MRRDLLDRKKHDRKVLVLAVLMSESLWLHFFVSDALPYWCVCMVRRGRPAVFVWLCKLHTVEDHVLYRKCFQSRGISASARCTLLESLFNVYTLLYVLDSAVTHNTSRRTAAGRLIALLVHLLTTVAWYSMWSSIVSDLHNHTNAAQRPQRAIQAELSVQAASNNV